MIASTVENRLSNVCRAMVGLLFVLTSPAALANDFPVGTVFVNIVSTMGCTNITGTGAVSGASATRVGSDFVISIPAGGVLAASMTVTVLNIQTTTLSNQSAQPATVNVTGAETILGAAGFGLLQLEDGVPVASGASLSHFGSPCQVVFTIFGDNPLDRTSPANKASSTTVQSSSAQSRTTSGVFIDASKAASVALGALSGRRSPNRFSASAGGAQFDTRGLSAGEASLPIGIWGNAAYTSSDNDSALTPSSSTRWHGSLGADWTHDDWLVTGLAIGYENDDTDTAFNGGNITTKGVTIAGYVGALLTEDLSVDLSVGRSFLRMDQFRTAGITRVTSDLHGRRIFLSGNANYSWARGDWRVTGRAGALWLNDTQDAFIESNGTAVASSRFRIGRVNLGGEIAYSFGQFEPYVGATHNVTFSQTTLAVGSPGRDRTDTALNIGTRFFGTDTLSGFLEFGTLLGRDDVDEHTFQFLLRSDF